MTQGAAQEIPLVCGKNLNSLFRHWLTDTLPVPIAGEGFTYYDTRDVLKELVIELIAPDVQLGLLVASVIERT